MNTWTNWFAWFPVTTLGGHEMWWGPVQRRWNDRYNFRIIATFDPGDYDGGWEYRLPLVAP